MKREAVLTGQLDLLVLAVLARRPAHGYAVLESLRVKSGGLFDLPEGSLYPALYRLEHQGLIVGEWGESENKRKAKYYRLTAAGKRRLRAEAEKWNSMADVIAGVLDTTPEEV